MRKRLSIFFIMIFLAVFTSCANGSNHFNQISGDLLMIGHDLYLYNLDTNKKTDIQYSIQCNNAEFSDNKDKILITYNSSSSKDKDGPAIVQYHVKDKTFETIIRKNSICDDWRFEDRFQNAKYIPHSQAISFVNNSGLFFYDLNSRKLNYITQFSDECLGDYCWAADGGSFIYSDEHKIYRFDVKSKKSKFLFDGDDPVYSHNNKLIAYFELDTKLERCFLYVKDLVSGKRFKFDRPLLYRFSPDDQLLILTESSEGEFGNSLWDFKKGKVKTLFGSLEGAWANDWK